MNFKNNTSEDQARTLIWITILGINIIPIVAVSIYFIIRAFKKETRVFWHVFLYS